MLRPPDLSRINKILLFTVLTGAILYFGKEFFIVVVFAGFLAMLMTPVSNWLEKYNVSRVFSSLISVLAIIAVLAGIGMLLSSQVTSLSEEFPNIKSKMEQGLKSFEEWVNNTLGVSSDAIESRASDAMSSAGGFITGLLKGIFSFFGGMLLILVFTFLFLLQREKYENFAVMLHSEDKRTEARKMMGEISKVAQQYLGGRLISILILAVLYIVGFSIVGLKNGLLLAVIAAIMTFIPYVGPLLGGFVPFFMAIVSGDFNQSIWVVVIITLAQLFDNYFIEPYVVGGSVHVSPFFTIFILLLGGAVWGIAGVILFLPLLGILKIIFDKVEGMKPYAYLIGDQKKSSSSSGIMIGVKNLFSGKKR